MMVNHLQFHQTLSRIKYVNMLFVLGDLLLVFVIAKKKFQWLKYVYFFSLIVYGGLAVYAIQWQKDRDFHDKLDKQIKQNLNTLYDQSNYKNFNYICASNRPVVLNR